MMSQGERDIPKRLTLPGSEPFMQMDIEMTVVIEIITVACVCVCVCSMKTHSPSYLISVSVMREQSRRS